MVHAGKDVLALDSEVPIGERASMSRELWLAQPEVVPADDQAHSFRVSSRS